MLLSIINQIGDNRVFIFLFWLPIVILSWLATFLFISTTFIFTFLIEKVEAFFNIS